jgi:thiol-disulfide isomerase/thioredoxin
MAVLVGAVALAGLVALPRLAPPQGGMVGKPAPEIVLPAAANADPAQPVRLSALKGHAVVLDFWASWCGPCGLQAPILDRIARRYAKQGLVVVGVNVDDPPERARAYANQKHLSYPIVVDNGSASKGYGVEKLPSLVVVDKEGRVAAYLSGIVDEASLDEIVAAAL